jgi:hypothetical protein
LGAKSGGEKKTDKRDSGSHEHGRVSSRLAPEG